MIVEHELISSDPEMEPDPQELFSAFRDESVADEPCTVPDFTDELEMPLDELPEEPPWEAVFDMLRDLDT